MTIKLTWDGADKRVVRWDIRDKWSLNEVREALGQTWHLYHGQPKQVFLVLNPIETGIPPREILDHLRAIDYSNLGIARIFVVVQLNPIQWILGFGRFAAGQLRCRIVPNLEDAYDLISLALSAEQNKRLVERGEDTSPRKRYLQHP